MGTVWRVNATMLTYLHCKFSFLWSRSKSRWQNSCSLIEWKDCKFFSSLLTNHNLLVIWEECCCWSSIVPPNSSVWGTTLIFTFNPLTLPSPLKCHEKESIDFWRYISQKKAEPWGFFLPCWERIDQISNALFKFDNISRFESHSQLLCWEWSQKFFSSWIGNAICAICAICAYADLNLKLSAVDRPNCKGEGGWQFGYVIFLRKSPKRVHLPNTYCSTICSLLCSQSFSNGFEKLWGSSISISAKLFVEKSQKISSQWLTSFSQHNMFRPSCLDHKFLTAWLVLEWLF